jgi:hypothetical protein
MNKLKLTVDDLAVESFSIEHGATRMGTVQARELTQRCGDTSICTGGSCDGTCYATCGDVNCASYYNQCGTADGSCLGPCFQTDGDQTCINTCLNTCSVCVDTSMEGCTNTMQATTC